MKELRKKIISKRKVIPLFSLFHSHFLNSFVIEILELTEKNIILETKRAQLEEMKQIKQNLQTKLQNNKIINECLLSTHQSDGTNGIQVKFIPFTLEVINF